MSGVCAKHHGYVQPGEACQYCVPAAEGGYPVPAQFVASVLSGEALSGSPVVIGPLMSDHRNRYVNRDACADCGMSGMAIAQQRTATETFWRSSLGQPLNGQALQESLNRLWARCATREPTE